MAEILRVMFLCLPHCVFISSVELKRCFTRAYVCASSRKCALSVRSYSGCQSSPEYVEARRDGHMNNKGAKR